MELPATIAAEAAITRGKIAISTIKQAAESDKKVAEILEDAIKNVPTSSLRGTNVNTTA